MSDQEITDRDETRRLIYTLLAARHPRVRGRRGLAELIGTTVNALTHHARWSATGTHGADMVNMLARMIFESGAADIAHFVREIDRLSAQIEGFKNAASPAEGSEHETPPREVFLNRLGSLFDQVANDPDGAWHDADTSGDTMHSAQVALDAYLRARDRMPGTVDQAEVDLVQALDMLDRVLGYFNEAGHPGYEALSTGWHPVERVRQWQAWAAEARGRHAGRVMS